MKRKDATSSTLKTTFSFTLLEFILAFFLSSLLIMAVYQVYHQVFKGFREEYEDSFVSWFLLTESLREALENRLCTKVLSGGKKPFFLYREEEGLAFLTSFGSGPPYLLAILKGEEKPLYFEKPYLGGSLPSKFEDLIDQERTFTLRPFRLKLFRIKGFLTQKEELSLENIEREELEELLGLPEGLYLLELSAPKGFKRFFFFPGCP